MINYEKLQKLQIAHELAEKSHGYYFKIVCGIEEPLTFELFDANRGLSQDETFVCNVGDDIDDLIQKLQGLTQPKAKYQIGQQVWMLDCENEPCELEIKDIDIGDVEKYLIRNEWRMEHALYPTKSALIEAQIEYWQKQMHAEVYPGFPPNTIHDAINYLSTKISNFEKELQPPFEGEIKGFESLLQKNAEDFINKLEVAVSNKFVVANPGNLPTEEEYCQVSGAKLDKCQHEYKKTLSKNGMYFIDMCHKCYDEQVWIECEECQHESSGAPHYLADQKFWHVCDKCDEYFIKKCEHENDGKYYVETGLGYAAFQTLAGANNSMTTGGVQYKCLKCGEFYR